MNVITEISTFRSARAALPAPVGLVPTMGFLHEGHLSLVRAAKAQCASVVVTIFVNPTQFGPNEDLDAYPRDLDRDLALLKAEGVDLVWTPTPDLVYPEGYQTTISVPEVAKYLEGPRRPGHFEGVATVVAKLFNVTQPDAAFFGQKDAQQTVVIRQMVRDLNFPLDIVVCPTVREPDGLALSSRNVYLDPAQRQAATALSRALRRARAAIDAGEISGDQIREIMADTLDEEQLVERQYVSCADPRTLTELNTIQNNALLSMAAFVGKTRLIDNFLLENGTWTTGH